VLVLVFIMLAGGGLWYARQMESEFAVVRESEEALLAAYGSPLDWSPATLVPDSLRIARFVEVRQALAEWRTRLAAHTTAMSAIEQGEGNPLGKVIRSIRAGSELATIYAGFWTARNEALLAAEMGAGEYIWLFHLAYHAWLGHDPGVGSDQGAWYIGAGDDGEATAELAVGEVDEERVDERQRQARRLQRERVLPLLEGAALLDAAAGAWRDAELDRLAADPGRVPWQTELPPAMGAAFIPFGDVLAAAWDPLANPVELLFEVEEVEAPEE
jgi:hypothetical protein